MTIIAGFCYATFSLLMADSRLSGGPFRRDICQKMFPLGPAGLVCWSGDLFTARGVMARIDERTRREGPWWLLDSDECERTVMRDYRRYGNKTDAPKVSFIGQLINPTRRAFEDEEWPRVDMFVLDIDPFFHEVQPCAKRVRGSGSVIEPAMDEQELLQAVVTFGEHGADFERQVHTKAFLAQTIIEDLVRDSGEDTVGGLYQLGYVLPHRARFLPYERWVPLKDHQELGSYVRMTMDNKGTWKQEHPGTGTSRALLNPFVDRVEDNFSVDLVFDAARFKPTTPGVYRVGSPHLWTSPLELAGLAETMHVPPHMKQYLQEPLGPEGTFRRVATLAP